MTTLVIFSAKYLVVLPVAVFGIYFLWQLRHDWIRKGIFAFASLALTYVLGRLAGYLFYNPRPFVVGHFTPLVAHAANNGFPSDHTLLLGALAAVGTVWNRPLGAFLWALALIVGAARVYAGIHHPIDILGSILLAIFATTVVHYAMKITD